MTRLGEAFLPRAEDILRQVASAKSEIHELAGLAQGKLIIGAIPTIAPYFLALRLASFAREFPHVLDLGARDGRFARVLAQRVGTVRVVAAEPSAAFLAGASAPRNWALRSKPAEARSGSATAPSVAARRVAALAMAKTTRANMAITIAARKR